MIYEIISKDEKVLWMGKPSKTVLLIKNVPIFLLGVFWGILGLNFFAFFRENGGAYTSMATTSGTREPFFGMGAYFLIPLIVMLLAPVYQWLRWMTEEYAITDRRVYFVSGIIGTDVTIITMPEIINLTVNVGLVERMTSTGTVRLTPDETMGAGHSRVVRFGYRLNSIEDPYGVFRMLRTLSLDVVSDLNYPNDFRPQHNPGYRTKYTGNADRK